VIVYDENPGLILITANEPQNSGKVLNDFLAACHCAFDFDDQCVSFVSSGRVKHKVGILLIRRVKIDMSPLVNFSVEGERIIVSAYGSYLVIEFITENSFPNDTGSTRPARP
jgi:hypothetical protein